MSNPFAGRGPGSRQGPRGGAVEILHLVSHPIQYFAPLYRELDGREDVDLTVVFMSTASSATFHDAGFGRQISWNQPLTEGYRSIVVESARQAPLPTGFARRPSLDLLAVVARADYDVLWLHGYAHLTSWAAWAVARLRRKAVLIREEQTLIRRRSLPKRMLKRVALRVMFRGAYGLYIGTRNRQFLELYGIRRDRLFHTPYCVENERFRAAAAELLPERDAIRAEYRVEDDRPLILFSGKLVATKAPGVLLDAFARVRRTHECVLVFVGDGPLRPVLEQAALTVPDVVFAGFHDQVEIARAYVAADVLVLPSLGETWGLVVNEALNFGLPVVATDKVGSSADLVRDGWNGYVVPAGDVGRLASALEQLVVDADRRAAFGAHGRELVADYDVAAAADGVVAAARASVGRSRSAA